MNVLMTNTSSYALTQCPQLCAKLWHNLVAQSTLKSSAAGSVLTVASGLDLHY